MVLHVIVLAENVIDVARGLTADVTGLLQAIALLAAIAVVVATYFKTRAWVPTLIAIAMAGIVVWAVNNTDFLRGSTDRTIREAGQADVRALVVADALQQQVQPYAAVRVPWGDDREF
jgi:hypothetical protein